MITPFTCLLALKLPQFSIYQMVENITLTWGVDLFLPPLLEYEDWVTSTSKLIKMFTTQFAIEIHVYPYLHTYLNIVCHLRDKSLIMVWGQQA